jgi:phosphopantetheinyl transferase
MAALMPPVPAVRPVVSVVTSAQTSELMARRLSSVLTPAERDQFDRLGSDKRRRDWLAGRLAAKAAVAQWCRERAEPIPQEVELANDQDGAPYFPALPRLRVSIAHGELGGVAAVHTALVGVDAERVAPRDPAVLAHFARADEAAPDAAAQTALWTVKEAVLKLLGLGFAGGLLNVRWDGADRVKLFAAAAERWTELGGAEIVVEQWFEGDTAFCLSFTQEAS